MPLEFGLRGLNLSTATEKKNNASGATQTTGSVCQWDIANQTGNTAAQIDKVIKPVTAGIAVGVLGVQADASLLNGVDGNFRFGEGVVVDVKVDGSGTAIAQMDPLKAQNASDVAVKATAGTDRWHFIALQAATTATTIKALLYSTGRK